jgi:hypothetical protein
MRNYLPIARAALPFTSSKDQFVAKKTKIFPSENLATIDTTSSPEAKIDKVKPRRVSTGSKKVAPSKKGARKTRSSAAAAAMAGPTDEEIRIRAYFISERRRRFALPGDANSDWIEAKRQLLSEIGPR